ncbi:hypothetical protein QTP88_001998 [Uroleucon formosanum]
MVLTTQQLTGQLKDTVLAKIVFSTTLVLEKQKEKNLLNNNFTALKLAFTLLQKEFCIVPSFWK